MSKSLLNYSLALGLILLFFPASVRAQGESDRIAEREALWQSYQLPAVDFVRHLDS